MATHTETIARWASNLKYDDLTQDAIDASKRFLFDTLGCGLGGFQTHDVKIFLEYEREMGALRVSLGLVSNVADIQHLIEFAQSFLT